MHARRLTLRVRLLLATIFLASACGESTTEPPDPEAEALAADAFCANHDGESIASFEDANLEAGVRLAAAVGSGADLTCDLLATITSLVADDSGIVSLVGIQNLPGLTDLDLSGNQIVDIARLVFLTSLSTLDLSDNPGLSDFGPLLTHPGLGAGATLEATGTSISCEDVVELEARGAAVSSDCVTLALFSATLQPGVWHGFIMEQSVAQPAGFPNGAHDRTRLNRAYALATPSGFTRWGASDPTAPGPVNEDIHAFQAEFNGSVWTDVLRLYVAANGPSRDVTVQVYAPGP